MIHLHPRMTLVDAAALAAAIGSRLECRGFRIVIRPTNPERHGSIYRDPMPRSWRSRPVGCIHEQDWLGALAHAGIIDHEDQK